MSLGKYDNVPNTDCRILGKISIGVPLLNEPLCYNITQVQTIESKTITVKELIQTAIDNLPEEQLDELYQLIKNFTASKNNLLEEKPSLFKRGFSVKNMVGKAKILGDIVSPIVDEEDWECLK